MNINENLLKYGINLDDYIDQTTLKFYNVKSFDLDKFETEIIEKAIVSKLQLDKNLYELTTEIYNKEVADLILKLIGITW